MAHKIKARVINTEWYIINLVYIYLVCQHFTMKKISTQLLLCTILFSFSFRCFAQTDTEFPKGFIMHAKLHNGMITNFKNATDLYTGGIQVIPQFTMVEHKLRGGIIAGAFYANKKIEGQFGPTIAVKLKTINAGPFGGAANLHLTADHIWGTGKQKLIGGGIHVDLLNKLVLGLTTHRDYAFNTWWLQTALGIKISKKKKTKEPFNE